MLDPGPDVDAHVRAVVVQAGDADTVRVVLTHHHADHAAAAPGVARALGADVWGPPGGAVDHVLRDGDSVPTDAGPLVAVDTPGHTREHLCFHWPLRRALFAGDLVLGHGDTTWVAEYPGCVADYLASLARLRALDLEVIHPAHGPDLTDPGAALDRFEAHRHARIRQAREAMEAHPQASLDGLLDVVYGDALSGDSVPAGMRRAARMSLEALVDHVRRTPDG